MLAKLLEIKDAAAQAQHLTQLIEMCQKNSQEFVTEATEELVKSLITADILNKTNFSQWLELSINLLSIQQCLQYAQADIQPSTPALKLLDAVGRINYETKYQKINTLLGKYTTIQLALVMHSLLARYCVSGVSEKKLPRLMPIFIRLSSFIVENYFKLKNEAAQGPEDMIDDDQPIIDGCERWLTKNISIFFSKMPKVNDPLIKSLVLLATSDIIGALMEIERQNLLDKDLATQLMEKVLLAYCRQNYTYNQIHSLFMRALESVSFSNILTKIQIPEVYQEQRITKVGLSTQAYTYIIVKFIQLGLLSIGSDKNLLKLLIPAVAQMMIRPYEIKVQAIQLLQNLLQKIKPIKISTCFQFEYPIQLFFFYLFQCEKEKYDSIRDSFLIENQEEYVNSLLILQGIFIQNLQKQKQTYITSMIQKHELYNERLIIFARKIKFKEQKPKRQLPLLDILGKTRSKNEKQIGAILAAWRKEADWLDPSVKSKFEELGL